MIQPGRVVGSEPVDEAEHFIVCQTCGQPIDCRRLGDVFHHEEPGHKPIGIPQ